MWVLKIISHLHDVLVSLFSISQQGFRISLGLMPDDKTTSYHMHTGKIYNKDFKWPSICRLKLKDGNIISTFTWRNAANKVCGYHWGNCQISSSSSHQTNTQKIATHTKGSCWCVTLKLCIHHIFRRKHKWWCYHLNYELQHYRIVGHVGTHLSYLLAFSSVYGCVCVIIN